MNFTLESLMILLKTAILSKFSGFDSFEYFRIFDILPVL